MSSDPPQPTAAAKQPTTQPSTRLSTLTPLLLTFALLPSFILYFLFNPSLDHLHPYLPALLTPLRQKLSLPSPCILGSICHPSQPRPSLPDGRESSAVWDAPRSLAQGKFTDISTRFAHVSANFIWAAPTVVYYDNVLTEDDVRLLIDTAIPRFEKSRVVAVDGSVQEDVSRTSESAWIYFSERPQLADIGRKVVALTGFPFTHAEAISVNRYSKTQYFNPHYDFLDEDVLRTDHMFPNCQRAATVLIYLSDVASGGESVFVRKGALDGRFKYDHMNEDHVAVRPKRGRVLIWYDMYPWSEEVDLRTLHGGAPVKEGVKIAATIFVRNCSSLESRQKEEL